VRNTVLVELGAYLTSGKACSGHDHNANQIGPKLFEKESSWIKMARS
jgi:hypothetical protein